MDSPERITHEIDQFDAWQRETIRRFGWALRAVLADEDSPPFVYTVGLSAFDHPELILFATSQATAAVVLNDLGRLVGAGRVLGAGDEIRLRNGRVHLLSFPESAEWLFGANDLYRSPDGPPVPALLVMPADELVPEPGEEGPCTHCERG